MKTVADRFLAGQDRCYEPFSTTALVLALAGGAAAAGKSIADRRSARGQQALTREQMEMERQLQLQELAAKESMADPFRQQLGQAGAISSLDRLELGTYKPATLGPAPARYAGNVPHITGGFSYEKSPELIQSAGALKRNVMGGNVAPTMTDPTNYGKTGALNLLAIAGDGVDPGTVSGSAGAPRDPGAYTADVQRRGGDGPKGMDVPVSHAVNVLRNVMRTELGREPQPGEIEQMLAGQGLKPGDRYVGDAGLTSLITYLRSQAAPQPSYAARA